MEEQLVTIQHRPMKVRLGPSTRTDGGQGSPQPTESSRSRSKLIESKPEWLPGRPLWSAPRAFGGGDEGLVVLLTAVAAGAK